MSTGCQHSKPEGPRGPSGFHPLAGSWFRPCCGPVLLLKQVAGPRVQGQCYPDRCLLPAL